MAELKCKNQVFLSKKKKKDSCESCYFDFHLSQGVTLDTNEQPAIEYLLTVLGTLIKGTQRTKSRDEF